VKGKRPWVILKRAQSFTYLLAELHKCMVLPTC